MSTAADFSRMIPTNLELQQKIRFWHKIELGGLILSGLFFGAGLWLQTQTDKLERQQLAQAAEVATLDAEIVVVWVPPAQGE